MEQGVQCGSGLEQGSGKKIEADGFEIHFEKGLGKTSVDWPLNISSL